MASKPYKNPIISVKGYNNLPDLLSVFPFDIVIKHCCVNNIKTNPSGVFNSIPSIIDFVYGYFYVNHLKQTHEKNGYGFNERNGLRLTTSCGQFELSYELS